MTKHLFVLLHGLHGRVAAMRTLESAILARFNDTDNDQAVVLIVRGNEGHWFGMRTHDGVDSGGMRAADEVEAALRLDATLTHVSVVGHSLGGIYARYLVGELLQRGVIGSGGAEGDAGDEEDDEVKRSDGEEGASTNNNTTSSTSSTSHRTKSAPLKPVNFITLASPNMGSRQHRRWAGAAVASFVAANIIGRTGCQLFLDDHDGTGGKEPLLRSLCRGHYLEALRLFKQRVMYANVSGDAQVSFCTASARLFNPYRRWPQLVDAAHAAAAADTGQDVTAVKKPFVLEQRRVVGDRMDDEAAPKKMPKTIRGDETLQFMHKQLNSLEWRRFDVFARLLFAHDDVIVAFRHNRAGMPIVRHIAAQLLFQ
eukprot:TRINITY_DN94159_c0_g1_i1.p1 TRINITY_DN94159_c0_g1~~TRINITY_DN94159_c0_g1_i1.p1  ORF type:complete len:369 (+),score=134.21 TRINITY_DN94159_c0_g1_i1:40-1146(+)